MKLDALELLDLSCNVIGPKGMEALTTALGTLRKLAHCPSPVSRDGPSQSTPNIRDHNPTCQSLSPSYACDMM
eukprot:3515581-Rhodomonas_salina.1